MESAGGGSSDHVPIASQMEKPDSDAEGDCDGAAAVEPGEAAEEIDTPACTSAAGWAALLQRLPHGLFSLDVRHNTLSHASYALLREHVAELRAGRVLSPAEEAAAASRCAAAVSKLAREAKSAGKPGGE